MRDEKKARNRRSYAERLARHDAAVQRAAEAYNKARDRRAAFTEGQEARAAELEARAAQIRAAAGA